MGRYVCATPASLTTATTDQRQELGALIWKDSNLYMYVKVASASANAASAGRTMYRTATAFEVSDDYSVAMSNAPAGLAIGVIAKSSFGYILVNGNYASALIVSGAVSLGDALYGSATDGEVSGGTDATTAYALGGIVGVAYEDGGTAGTTIGMLVQCSY